MTKRQILKEPLLYFLIIGLIIFFINSWVKKNSELDRTILPPDKINVDSTVIKDLKQQYQVMAGVNPDQTTLDQLIDNYIFDEVLYREGLKAGVQYSDETKATIVRQMRELKKSELEIQEISDQQLDSFYAQNVNLFYMTPIDGAEDIADFKTRIRKKYITIKQNEYLNKVKPQLIDQYEVVR